MQTAQQILAGPEYFLCKTFNCRMSRESCARRRATAQEKDEEGGYNIYQKCLECGEAKEKPMDPKKCHVDGCGKKVLAKGMCSSHYFKAREKEKKAPETKAPTPEKKQPIPETKAPEPEKQPDPPKAPESKTAQASPEKNQTKIIPKIIPDRKLNENKARGTVKRVNVQFSGPDVEIWERLRDSAKRNRRDIRTEALFIIEQSLTVEPEVYS